MTKAEKEYLSRVADVGCIACAIQGTPGTFAEIHHLRAGQGMSQRSDYHSAVGLCPAHHRGTDHPRTPSIHLAKRAFISRFGTEEQLLEEVRKRIGEAMP